MDLQGISKYNNGYKWNKTEIAFIQMSFVIEHNSTAVLLSKYYSLMLTCDFYQCRCITSAQLYVCHQCCD